MINDHLTDLEPLLRQYDAGEMLVGPLSLSLNSNFRYFEIAGNGNKVYEIIALGFNEAETDAQRQREGVVEKLKSRFDKVTILGSHLEMAETAHRLWPNQETIRALIAASLEAKLKSPKGAGANESIDDGSSQGVVQEEYGEQLRDEVAQEPIAQTPNVDPALTCEPVSNDDQKQPMTLSRLAQILVPTSLPNVNSSWPLRDDRAVTRQQRPLGLDDVVAPAVLELKSAEGGVPKPVGEPGTRSLTPIMLRFGAAVGGVAALAACLMVFMSMWKAAREPVPASISAPLTSVNRDSGASEQTTRAQAGDAPAVEPSSSPAHIPSVQDEPAPVSQPQSPPTQTESTQAGDAPVVEPSPSSAQIPSTQAELVPVQRQSPPTQTESTQARDAPVAEPSPSSAQIPSAQAELVPVQRQSPPTQTESTQAGDAPVAEPSPSSAQIPSAQAEVAPPAQTGSTQTEAAAISVPSSAPPQLASAPARAGPVSTPPSSATGPSSPPTQMANAKAEPGPVSGFPSPPAQGNSTIIPLNSDAIAMLVSRANDFLNNDDFASARLLLRRAAEAGDAKAALMLGATFDPLVLHERGAIGIASDIAQARQWYEKAAKLGSDVAAQRLTKLSQISH
jgi:hypothetical protein